MDNAILQQSNPPKSKWKKRIVIFLVSLSVLFVIFILISGITYSSGARTGVVIKISDKGYLFKTYEGELNLGGISEGDGTIMPTRVWLFSVQRNDTAVYNTIIRTQGKHVRLYYKEVLKRFFWQGETSYYVNKIEVVR